MKRNWYVALLISTILALALAACGSGGEQGSSSGEQSPQDSSPAGSSNGAPPFPLDQEAVSLLWLTSPHASTFVMSEDGTNSSCARCHSPVNWIPTMDDMPPSCSVCKFEVEPPPPVVPEADWQAVGCIICHKVNSRGDVDPEFMWLEIAQIDQYAEVATATELCAMCHSGVELQGHSAHTVEGAHAGYECTDCHDAHETTASCSSSGCHEDVTAPATPISGHDVEHKDVTCGACHDAGEMQIGLDEDGLWVTFFLQSLAGAESVQHTSHNLQREVSCERCHYLNNPWNLSADAQK